MRTEEQLDQTITELGNAFEAFKSEHARQLVELKKGASDPLSEQKLSAIQQKLDDLTGKKEDLEKRIKLEREEREELERKVNKLRIGGNGGSDDVEQKALSEFNAQVKSIAIARQAPVPADIDLEGFRAYKSAFAHMMKKGRDPLGADEVKAMQVGIDADGGFLVPSDTSGRVAAKVYELSPIRQIATVQAISSDRLEGIEDTGEASAGWVAETGTRSDTNTPQVGKYEIVAHEMYAQPKATQKLLDDAAVDIEGWLAAKVADKFARLEGAAFITGTGVGQPRGFAAYTTAATADASRAWGQLEHVKSGANGDFAASTPADVLFDLIGAFKESYLNGARWVTRRSVIAKIRKFKEATTNAYMWQPGLQAGQPSQLLGFPVTMAEDMPALGTGSLSLALGNFALGYQIVDRLGVRVLRDPYTDKPYVKFYTIRRTGGQVVQFEAIKFIQFAA